MSRPLFPASGFNLSLLVTLLENVNQNSGVKAWKEQKGLPKDRLSLVQLF